ncbi:MAG: hypothetical protein WDO13_08505 [Verrucomicrobiota bacterium]
MPDAAGHYYFRGDNAALVQMFQHPRHQESAHRRQHRRQPEGADPQGRRHRPALRLREGHRREGHL